MLMTDRKEKALQALLVSPTRKAAAAAADGRAMRKAKAQALRTPKAIRANAAAARFSGKTKANTLILKKSHKPRKALNT